MPKKWELVSKDGTRFKEGIKPGGEFDGIDLKELKHREPFSGYNDWPAVLNSMRAYVTRNKAALQRGKKAMKRLSTIPDEKKSIIKASAADSTLSSDESDDPEEPPSPFHTRLPTRQIIYFNRLTQSRDVVLMVTMPHGLEIGNFKEIEFNTRRDRVTIAYELGDCFENLRLQQNVINANQDWYELFQAQVYTDNEQARGAAPEDAPIWCTMTVDLPFPVYHKKSLQELKPEGVVTALVWKFNEKIVQKSASKDFKPLHFSSA